MISLKIIRYFEKEKQNMRKHHLLLAYIFMAIFSFTSIAMDGADIMNGPSRKNRVFGKIKAVFSRHSHETTPAHGDTRPNGESANLAAQHQKPPEGLDPRKQEASLFSETFPGADAMTSVKVHERGPMGVPHALTDHAVSVCTIQDHAYKEQICLVYLGKDSLVYAVQSHDLLHWTKPIKVFGDEIQASTYVHCVAFKYQPYVFCGGKITFLKDGINWAPPYNLEHWENSLFVTMQAHNDTIYAAHTGKDHHLYFTSSEDAVHWKPLKRIGKWETQLPVCLVYESAIQAACVTNTGSTFIASLAHEWNYIPQSKDSMWKTKHPISLCEYGNNLWVAHLGENNKVYISVTRNAYNEDKEWSEANLLKIVQTDQSVCLFEHTLYKPEYDKSIFITYTGLDGQVYITSPASH
jgi:hypothetical protein